MTGKISSNPAKRLLSARHLLLLVFALSLTFPALISAQQSAAKQQVSAKRALTHQDYDGWRSIQGQTLSRDGKFIAYAAVPQDGDGEIIVRNLATGAEFRSPRGWRPPPFPNQRTLRCRPTPLATSFVSPPFRVR